MDQNGNDNEYGRNNYGSRNDSGSDNAGYGNEGGQSGKKLYRSNTSAMILGICGGIGNYFNCDPTIIRLLFVFFGFCSAGTGLLAYLIAGIIIPKSPFNE